jgi:uncharacterized protein (DUF1800 family)
MRRQTVAANAGGRRTPTARILWVVILGAALLATPGAGADPAAPARARLRAAQDDRVLRAGHLLRRLGFGPNRREVRAVLRLGEAAYIEQQLHPATIDDRLGERRFYPPPAPDDDGSEWLFRWLSRMLHSRRQLLEKMTLTWHEHFATSNDKVGALPMMRDQEQLLRAHALGSFRALLAAISRDNAMLVYLDNAYNDGRAVDELGNPIPPNENYARELLQLFSLGVYRLNMDGSIVRDPHGAPLPAYTEADVKEVARALTGWLPHYPQITNPGDPTEILPPADFEPGLHDAGAKTLLGRFLPADEVGGAFDVERVVDAIMRHPTTAPFISKILIQKLATETPTPGYVERVATVFAATDGDIRAVVRAILTDAEFGSPATLRSQYRTPIDHVVGALRGLGARGGSRTVYFWTLVGGHLIYYPPSVFSFYPPGQKASLLTASSVATLDAASDSIANGFEDDFYDAGWDAAGLIRRYRLQARPELAVDLLARELLAAPLSAATRQVMLDYLGPRVDERGLRGAAWLLLCSPDYQVM